MTKSRNIIPIHMIKISNDDQDSVTAVTSLQDAMVVDNIREILEGFEKQYKQMVKEISTMLNEIKKSNRRDPLICWKIGNIIYNLVYETRKKGIAFTNYQRTLARDLHISQSRISYFLRFRELHPTIHDVNPSIPWTWYIELNLIKDHQKLKRLEADIKTGKIKTFKELKRLVRASC